MPEARVAFVTLGCKVNRADSDGIARALGPAVATSHPAQADVIIINTCTVTAEADRKARKAVRHALGLGSTPVVVVTGCLATLDAAALLSLGDRVVVEPDKQQVPAAVRRALERREPDADERESRPCASVVRHPQARARVQLKVEDGCDAFCSYCIVPYARGAPRAVPIAEVVAEARRLVAEGVSEIVLTGINIGRYRDHGAGLPDVLEAVAATGIPRVRVSSIEPGDVSERFLAVAAATGAFCPHLHIPLQSGADGVLARMGRPYTSAEYAAVVALARGVFPGIAITADAIVGFPGETDEEFARTLAFAEAQAFSRLHVFRYSARHGTPAAGMPSQVPAEVKASRSAQLRELGDRLAAGYVAGLAGAPAELLVERVHPGTGHRFTAEGTTREYLRLRVAGFGPANVPRPGVLLRVRIERPDACGEVRARIIA